MWRKRRVDAPCYFLSVKKVAEQRYYTMEDEVQRATHKRRTLTPAEKQAQALEEMFKNPKRAMRLPSPPRSAYKVREPPEMVDHVQGSSAGVGSGEFHVYKMTRRLESDRIQAMQDEADRVCTYLFAYLSRKLRKLTLMRSAMLKQSLTKQRRLKTAPAEPRKKWHSNEHVKARRRILS